MEGEIRCEWYRYCRLFITRAAIEKIAALVVVIEDTVYLLLNARMYQAMPWAMASLSIFLMSPCSTAPGPHSVKSVAPSAIMFLIVCVQRTEAVSWATRFFLISAGSVGGRASTF